MSLETKHSLKYQFTVCFWTVSPGLPAFYTDRASVQAVGGAISEKKKLRYIYYTMLRSNYNFVIIVWIVIASKLFTVIALIWHTNTTCTKSAVVFCIDLAIPILKKRLLSSKEYLHWQLQVGKQNTKWVHGKSISQVGLPTQACRLYCSGRTWRWLQFRSLHSHALWLYASSVWHIFLIWCVGMKVSPEK